MNFGHYTYLVSIAVISAFALGIEWWVYPQLLRQHFKTTLVISTIAMLAYVAGEWMMLRLGVFGFSPATTLNIFILDVSLEVYLYGIFATAAVVQAAIIFASFEKRRVPFIKTWLADFSKSLRRFRARS